jgi:hypothetical protein
MVGDAHPICSIQPHFAIAARPTSCFLLATPPPTGRKSYFALCSPGLCPSFRLRTLNSRLSLPPPTRRKSGHASTFASLLRNRSLGPRLPFADLPLHYSTSVQLDAAASQKVPVVFHANSHVFWLGAVKLEMQQVRKGVGWAPPTTQLNTHVDPSRLKAVHKQFYPRG